MQIVILVAINSSVIKTIMQSESDQNGNSGSVGRGVTISYVPYSTPLPGQSHETSHIFGRTYWFYYNFNLVIVIFQKQSSSKIILSLIALLAELNINEVLTEGGLRNNGRGLLRGLAEAVQVDGLDTEHVVLTWGKAMDHKPDRKNHGDGTFVCIFTEQTFSYNSGWLWMSLQHNRVSLFCSF